MVRFAFNEIEVALDLTNELGVVLVGDPLAQVVKGLQGGLCFHVVLDVAVVTKELLVSRNVFAENNRSNFAETRVIDHAVPRVGFGTVVQNVAKARVVVLDISVNINIKKH